MKFDYLLGRPKSLLVFLMSDYPSIQTFLELQEKLIHLSSSEELFDIVQFINRENIFQEFESSIELIFSIRSIFNANLLSKDYLRELLIQLTDQLAYFFKNNPGIWNLFDFKIDKYFILQLLELNNDFIKLPKTIKDGRKYFSPEIGFNFHNMKNKEFQTPDEFFVNRKNGENLNELSQAIRKDDMNLFTHLISQTSLKINASSIPPALFERFSFIQTDVSLVEYAAFFSSIQIFKYLILNDAQFNNELTKYAIAGGNNEIIHICEDKSLSFKKSINIAIQQWKNELVEYLLQEYSFNEESFTIALKSYNYQIVKKIIDETDESQISNLIQKTIIHGHLSILNYLISLGFINKIKDELFLMIINHKIKMFEETLYTLEDLDFINDINPKYNMRLVDYSLNKDIRCFEILCSFEQVDMNEKLETQEDAPILKIAKAGRFDLFELLASDENIDINLENKFGETVLHIACQKGNIDAVKMIVSLDCIMIDRKTNDGKTPLHYAVEANNIEIVKFLVNECGAEKSYKDNKGVDVYISTNSMRYCKTFLSYGNCSIFIST
ncbi:hypothetical protein TRFO_31260 [Tritrichomonas foetus]|uniref:DUF3447 domain-containing protein n=1 Tax=Tritrichomonas foetus TaxID=1144522 RepID=A0A1J4JSQ1_9EUKA|nr:hypothetical protein TRFO_31260 [Tritrichomonas foetus]|eukprot:OHT01786.1 hypothetical protein TRFO_31260 [Tritrichomonas foetus]